MTVMDVTIVMVTRVVDVMVMDSLQKVRAARGPRPWQRLPAPLAGCFNSLSPVLVQSKTCAIHVSSTASMDLMLILATSVPKASG